MSTQSRLYLCHTTAALFWRAVHEGRLPQPKATELRQTEQPVCSYRELRDIDLSPLGLKATEQGAFAWLNQREVKVVEQGATYSRTLFSPKGIGLAPGVALPIDLLTAVSHQNKLPEAVRLHELGGSLPAGSLMRVTERMMVASPELTMVQLCATGRVLPAIELGMEWCGSYAIASTNCPNPKDAQPLFTRSSLLRYLEEAKGLRGLRHAREAARWIADGSASVRETELYLALTLPRSLGGYGLQRPQMNVEVQLGNTATAQMTSDAYYVVDLLFDENVVVEYDGRDDHEVQPLDVTRDKERRSVLAALGYKVIVVTRRDVSDTATLHKKVSQIAQAMGVELPVFAGEEAEAHETLVRWLFNPHHDHLPFGFGYT